MDFIQQELDRIGNALRRPNQSFNAVANGHGWNRFLHTVDQVLPRRGDTLPLPFGNPDEKEEAAN